MAKRVLVVDDEMDVRTFITTLLDSNGYKAVVAENGEQGWQKFQEKKPDMVTLDVMMPKESGIKMYRNIKTDPNFADVPVLIISGLARKTFLHSQKVLDQFKNQSVPEPDGYIEKPPEPEELLGEIKRIIG
ncbi:MAG: response regulator [Desulfarculaceae bacterium]|nr:response regulator [Desulfarculaceae bacterium]MCF8046375.1 response regulator [Desulfarculaceae bacterium]MCF8064855.1 response regulator [Desulfarculaceae bacterium]MCF8097366.1 response regulator [Desulfarculaceae bacterium]MCF8123209.1 response regulator [Desulfarculaceae bacterium]